MIKRDKLGRFIKGIKPNNMFEKGRVPWNKEVQGIHLSPETEFKPGHKNSKIWKETMIKRMTGKNNPKWKGNDVGYLGLHAWINRQLGKPKVCEHCGAAKNLHWANVDHTYRRNLDDWISLCVSCHKKYDTKNHLIQPNKRDSKGQFISKI